jgi:hypothetical protein
MAMATAVSEATTVTTAMATTAAVKMEAVMTACGSVDGGSGKD